MKRQHDYLVSEISEFYGDVRNGNIPNTYLIWHFGN